jgi:hypothetical protein
MTPHASASRQQSETPASESTHDWVFPVFLFCFAVSVLKGVRMPSLWAITHYVFAYDFGFMKRAFWGEVLRRTLGERTGSYFWLAAVAFGVFVLIVWLLLRECWRLPHRPGRAALLLVFAASPALTFLAHLVGYLEQIGYLLVLVIAALRGNPRIQAAVAFATAALAPLVHEANVFWIGPLSLLAILTAPPVGPVSRLNRLRTCAAIALVWIISTGAVVSFGRVSPEHAHALQQNRAAVLDVTPRQDAFATLSESSSESLRAMRRLWAWRTAQLEFALSLAVFAPCAIFLTLLGTRIVWPTEAASSVTLTPVCLVLLAPIGPLLLHVVGWDVYRWNALAALNAGLASVMVFQSHLAVRSITVFDQARFLGAAAVIFVWSISSDPVLFDDYRPSHPPYRDRIYFLIDAVRHPDRSRWIPQDLK